MKIPATVLMIILSLNASAQKFDTDYEEFNRSSKEERYRDCIDKGNKLLQTTRHPTILYKLAECYCQVDSVDKSLNILNELTEKGLYYDIAENKHLNRLADHREYKNLVKKFATNLKSIHNSEYVFTLDDARLIPEGITATSDGKTFYIGSLAQSKIVEYVAAPQKKIHSTGTPEFSVSI